MEYNIYFRTYIDLNRQKAPVIVLGALWCPHRNAGEMTNKIGEIKQRIINYPNNVLGWSNACESNRKVILSIVDWFFRKDCLQFNAFVVPGRAIPENLTLDLHKHECFFEWFNELLGSSLKPVDKYHIYMSLKDPELKESTTKLKTVLLQNFTGPELPPWIKINHVYQNDIRLSQLSDVLTGAVSYSIKGFSANQTKHDVVTMIRLKTGQTLLKNTPGSETKFSLKVWEEKDKIL